MAYYPDKTALKESPSQKRQRHHSTYHRILMSLRADAPNRRGGQSDVIANGGFANEIAGHSAMTYDYGGGPTPDFTGVGYSDWEGWDSFIESKIDHCRPILGHESKTTSTVFHDLAMALRRTRSHKTIAAYYEYITAHASSFAKLLHQFLEDRMELAKGLDSIQIRMSKDDGTDAKTYMMTLSAIVLDTQRSAVVASDMARAMEAARTFVVQHWPLGEGKGYNEE